MLARVGACGHVLDSLVGLRSGGAIEGIGTGGAFHFTIVARPRLALLLADGGRLG